MAKYYLERNYKRLNNGKNDSRYTPSYFLNEHGSEFRLEMFPDYKDKGMKEKYGMEVDDRVEWVAVITYDENLMTPKDVRMELKSFKDYFQGKELTKAELETKLQQKGLEKIDNTTYKISDEIHDWDVTYPAQYLHI